MRKTEDPSLLSCTVLTQVYKFVQLTVSLQFSKNAIFPVDTGESTTFCHSKRSREKYQLHNVTDLQHEMASGQITFQWLFKQSITRNQF